MEKMLAAVFHKSENKGGKLELEEVNVPQITKNDQVLIEIKACGICGTDLKIMEGGHPATDNTILGHEFVGSIVELGKNIDNFSIGDRVAIEPIIACEVRDLEPCDSCKTGNINLCSNLEKGAISPGALMGFCKDTGGGWGEYVVAHKSLRLFNLLPKYTLGIVIMPPQIRGLTKPRRSIPWGNRTHRSRTENPMY